MCALWRQRSDKKLGYQLARSQLVLLVELLSVLQIAGFGSLIIRTLSHTAALARNSLHIHHNLTEGMGCGLRDLWYLVLRSKYL